MLVISYEARYLPSLIQCYVHATFFSRFFGVLGFWNLECVRYVPSQHYWLSHLRG